MPSRSLQPNLDILRAVAVLLVLADHGLEVIGHRTGRSANPYDAYAGRLGVLLFFVHTSFVLMGSMDRLGLRGRALLRSFYVRRAFRIYPLAVVCILTVVACRIPWLPWESFEPPRIGAVLANLTLTMNLSYTRPLIGPLWSLPIELQMYLVLPFCYLLLRERRTARPAVAVLVGAVALAIALGPRGHRFDVFVFAPCFVSGVLAWHLSRTTRPNVPGWVLLPGLALLGTVYALLDDRIAGLHPAPLAWLTCLVVALAIPRLKPSTSTGLNTAAKEIARYSYGIYVWHTVALFAGSYALSAPVALQVATVLLTLVALSVASFHWIEQPMIRLGARVAAHGGSGA
jgi:peptidoglycan/LPS O-acetylase OafA/YrhL